MSHGRSTLSGGVTGASIGSSFGPIGTAAGAVIGAGIGYLSGRRNHGKKGHDDRLKERNEALLKMLNSYNTEAQNADPLDSQHYRTGLAEMNDEVQDQAGRDAGSAARRGLTGSEYELAQAANRTRAMVGGRRGLLADSERVIEQRKRDALARLLQGYGIANATDVGLLNRSDQQKQAWANQLAAMASTVVQQGGFGSGGQSALQMPSDADMHRVTSWRANHGPFPG